MKKIYLLLCFYLLKIDSCGSTMLNDNSALINSLITFQTYSIPAQINKPDYKKSFDDLIKVQNFSFKGKAHALINENDFCDALAQRYKCILDNIEEKKKSFQTTIVMVLNVLFWGLWEMKTIKIIMKVIM